LALLKNQVKQNNTYHFHLVNLKRQYVFQIILIKTCILFMLN